jgi:hypothetical protein
METSMKLNDDDLARLEAHMNNRWKNDCPFCGERAWASKGELTLVPIAGVSGGQGFPSIPVRCDNCGFMAGIDPSIVGVDLAPYGFTTG